MPIAQTIVVSYKLMKINVDMTTMSTWCYFQRSIGDLIDGGVEMNISGTDMGVLLGTPSAGGVALGDEITDAIYRYAVDKGHIAGAVS